MTELEQKILWIVSNANGISAKDIAHTLNIPKADVNAILYRLSNSGLCKQDERYHWHIDSIADDLSNAYGSNLQESDGADIKLNNLCKYFLNCIALDDSNEVRIFQSSQFDLDYQEVYGVEKESLYTEKGKAFISTAVESQKSVYLGYPLIIENYTSRNQNELRFVAPVLMFPIDYNAGNISINYYPRINLEALRLYASKDKEERLQDLLQLEHELGIDDPNAEFDAEDIVMRLQSIRAGWNWKEDIKPAAIMQSPSIQSLVYDGIYNKAAIIRCEKSPYTQGLETELNLISNKTEAEYKGTALYDWIHRDFSKPFEDENTTIDNSLLEVLPVNTEQKEAIQKAMNSRLTIVTGPPGTGKSQVVTDLIVNLAWKSKSAIFSSKNNKAVDVVEQRVNNLGKTPIMLRLGSSVNTSNLIEFFSNLLSKHSGSQYDRQDYNQLKSTYDKYVDECNLLLERKQLIMTERNALDTLENRFCQIRDKWGGYLTKLSNISELTIPKAYHNFCSAWNNAQKENHGLFVRLFWSFSKKEKLAELNNAEATFNQLIWQLPLPKCSSSMSRSSFEYFCNEMSSSLEPLEQAWLYAKALSRFKAIEPLEVIDKKLLNISKQKDSIALSLWNKWLMCNNVCITGHLRNDLSNFVAGAKMLDEGCNFMDDTTLRHLYEGIQNELKNLLPIAAITSLSTHRRVPLTPGLFDLLIIDEASQCDIASILPLMYRAKRMMIIGDPKQLSHISTIVPKQDKMLIERYSIEPKWSYSVTSLYRLAESMVDPEDIILLKDHHRCHGDIIGFSNDEFYHGSLRVATDYNRLKTPVKDKPGIRWIDVNGNTYRPRTGSAVNKEETNAVLIELNRLISCGFTGSIGVVTPFRAQAESIQRELENNSNLNNELITKHAFLADTVHKFQGDERDVMIFSTVISQGVKDGAISFLSKNGNLFNVAITRARSELIVVGNKKFCASCSVPYMENFVKYYDHLNQRAQPCSNSTNSYGRDYPLSNLQVPISEWEIMFYQALYDAGIQTIPQYSVDKYYLDLALFKNGKKLDIEVDGERYHKSWNGELCYRDQLRNQRLYELGWDVKRFWVYQLRDDLKNCIDNIKLWYETA